MDADSLLDGVFGEMGKYILAIVLVVIVVIGGWVTAAYYSSKNAPEVEVTIRFWNVEMGQEFDGATGLYLNFNGHRVFFSSDVFVGVDDQVHTITLKVDQYRLTLNDRGFLSWIDAKDGEVNINTDTERLDITVLDDERMEVSVS